MSKPNFPNEIYVSWFNDDRDNEDRSLNASESEFGAINDDGPSYVATYKLIKVRRLDKVVKELNR